MTRYISTRGHGTTKSQVEGTKPKSFEDVLLEGLAPDGGLYIPESWPVMDQKILERLGGLPYADVAMQVMLPFIGDSISHADLRKILAETYEKDVFRHASVTPLVQISPNIWLMEHFHGPTLAFKDVALQFLGRVFDHTLKRRKERITVVGATSGDTGSAAIEAIRHCEYADIFILHPRGRVSEVQRRQMTTVNAKNVYNIAIDGTFDDCQNLVKAMFNDVPFRKGMNLSAINSINWARIMAQVVYYFTAALALGAPRREVSFSVPTGNFGNIFAAYVARQMGVPIKRLIISTNKNDILTRFFETGEMKLDHVSPTYSPSMDIQISSNFERYLFDLMQRDTIALNGVMNDFKKNGKFELGQGHIKKAWEEFTALRCTDEETLKIMRNCYAETGIIIDPHTAVGLHGALSVKDDPSIPIVALACAHPAKFPDAVEKAIGIRPPLPDHLSDLLEREEFLTALPNDLKKLEAFIQSKSRV
ncbi:MAG: threonine synthase [Alphaproteobacteria bacterium]